MPLTLHRHSPDPSLSIVRSIDGARDWFLRVYADACKVRQALSPHVATPSPWVVCMRADGSWAEVASLEEAEAVFAIPLAPPAGAVVVLVEGRRTDVVDGGDFWQE